MNDKGKFSMVPEKSKLHVLMNASRVVRRWFCMQVVGARSLLQLIFLSGYWHTDTVNCLGGRVRQRLARLALEWVTKLHDISITCNSLSGETFKLEPRPLGASLEATV